MSRLKPMIITKPPGPKAKAILERDAEVSSRSMARVYPLVISKTYDVNFEDVDGNRYIDFNSGIAVMNFGYSNPKIIDAIKEQVENATHAAFLEYYSELPVKFSEELLHFMPYMDRVFLANSGTESVEAAMKLSRYYTNRKYFVAFYGSFHGRSLGALSLTSSKIVHRKYFGPFLPTIHVPYANPYRCPFEAHIKSEDECADACLNYLENVVFKNEVSPDEVAAIFVEPVQGEGGYVVPPVSFLRGLREICDKYGILYVDDEVQAGCFRTGKFLGIEHFGIKPDIITLAKALGGGLPLGAMVTREEIMNWPPGSHASTFGGNLISCVAGLAVLEIMRDEKLGEEVEQKGKCIMQQLMDLQKECKIIGNVRGLGLMIGLELVKDQRTKEPAVRERDAVVRDCFENGLALLPAGESTIRIAPPLVMTKEDIDTSLEILSKSLRKATKEVLI